MASTLPRSGGVTAVATSEESSSEKIPNMELITATARDNAATRQYMYI